MTPPRRAIGPMHELLPTLLAAFGNRPQAEAAISHLGQPADRIVAGKGKAAGE